PQNPATAPIKPRWSAIGSPEADDRREPASPDRHTKTTPPRARQTPASLPPGAIPPIKESRRCPKRYGFFNSLLVSDHVRCHATSSRISSPASPSRKINGARRQSSRHLNC